MEPFSLARDQRFSDPPQRSGMNAFAIADLWAELMTRLGYEKFAAQGGDWGASVATCLGLRHPERLIGLHFNYIPGSYRPDAEPDAEARAFLASAGDWADEEGAYGHHELLTHVMVYWVTRSATSAARLYREGKRRPIHFEPGERVRVPCAVARVPREEPFPPRSWIERGYDLARFTEMPRGGHFAAWEEPELLAGDLRAFFLAQP